MRVSCLVLFHNVLGGRVVDSQQVGRFLDGCTLHLDDINQVLSLVRLDLNVAALSPGDAAGRVSWIVVH